MFDFVKDWFAPGDDARAAREAKRQQEAYEAEQRRRAQQDRESKIASIRVLTGDLKHRYALIESLRAYGHYRAVAGEPYDPLEATNRAIYQLQRLAFDVGADAVIHARYQIIRYIDAPYGARYAPVPSYEVHAFGTAVKVLGPPADWELVGGHEQD